MLVKLIKYSAQFILFLFLTIISQIGGIVYILAIFTSRKWRPNFKGKTILIYFLIYSLFTFIIVPYMAPIFGREKIAHASNIKPTNYLTVFLNRNYVTTELNDLLKGVSNELKLINSDVEIRYLDANFPFFKGFPLFPHLSHNDGQKIDLSLIYQTPEGHITNEKKSISGYGVFEGPKESEINQIDMCLNKGFFQYNYPKYLTFGKINDELKFSEDGTKLLINTILNQPKLGKVFMEPHLKERMNIRDNKVRYHGCKAVRHDDHIHIQL